jgi:uncharacterized damage-inducible protein DinB
MNELTRIADQLQRAFYGEAWHGPALMELLRDLDAATASAHRMRGAHNIWEILLHLTAWNLAVRRRLQGEAVELRGEQDWPRVAKFSDLEWQNALRALENSHISLYEAVRDLPESGLAERVPGKDYDVYFMLHGVIQHILYHAGQVALLKKNG